MNTYNQFFAGHDGGAMEITNATQRDTDGWFYDWATGGGKSIAGVAVNGYTALTHCPIWQGINIIAGDIGQTPVRLMKNKFTEQKQHPASQLLRLRPNGLQTPATFLETIVQWALMWGNGVAWIQRQGSRPYRLIPLRPDCLWLELIDFEGQEVLLYHYYSPLRNGTQYTFFPWEVIDIPGLTADGVCGYALHQIAKNTIGFGMALEKHGAAMFANGAVPGGVLEAPMGNGISRSKEARDNLRTEWNAVHRGPDKAGAIAILWEGIQYKAMGHTNVDAQWLEAKKMSVYDAASLLNLPPHKLGAMEDSSVRANLEEQNADYKQRSLSRIYNKLSQEFRRKLLTEKEWMSDEYAFIWDTDAFMGADVDTATTIADRNVKATIWNPNEAREYLGYAPREGGDVYGSPAINPTPKPPQRPEDGKESPDNGRPENKSTRTSVKDAHLDLLHDRVLHFRSCEFARLRNAVENAKNFVKWLDEFYDVGGQFDSLAEAVMRPTLKACAVAGIDVSRAATVLREYAESRRARALEISSQATKEHFSAAMQGMLKDNYEDISAHVMSCQIRGDEDGIANY